VQRLEALLCSRLQKIDELTTQVDQLRQQNRRLDAEAKPSMTAE
jgi:outer membrane murein-binding lipoprotein Lpp